MAEPKEQQDSAVRLAKIIAKLMVEVENLRKDLDGLNVMFNSMSNIVNVMMNDVTNSDTQKKLMEVMLSTQGFIQFVADHEETGEEIYDKIMSGDTPIVMPDDMTKEEFLKGFERTKEMFTLARHEMDFMTEEE
mgnify:FL=1